MSESLLYSRKIILFYLITVLIISITGSVLELFAIFNNTFKMVGITGNIFYLYVFLLETVLFSTALILNLQKSNKFFSYFIIGAAISLVISILNILIVLTHLLLIIYPISSSEYNYEVLVKEFSLIIIIGLFSTPFIILFKKNDIINF